MTQLAAQTNKDRNSRVKLTNAFLNFNVSVTPGEYDNVVAFLKSVMKDQAAVELMTDSIFQVSELSGTPVMELLAQLKSKTGMELTANMAYFLNTIRSNSILLGVSDVVVPNHYASRNVVV